MNSIRHAVAALAIVPAASSAASLAVYPPYPTTQDPLILEVQAAPPCATVALHAVHLADNGVIRVPFDDGSRVLCSRPNSCPLVIPLGRMPPGNYVVEFVPDRASLTNASATQVTVYAAAVPGIPGGYTVPRRRRGHTPVECD